MLSERKNNKFHRSNEFILVLVFLLKAGVYLDK